MLTRFLSANNRLSTKTWFNEIWNAPERWSIFRSCFIVRSTTLWSP